MLQIFTYILSPSRFLREAEFWSLMWFVVAIGLGFCYLVLGIVAVNLQHFICAAYRQQYFTAIIRQKMLFFDDENNSVGTLTSRVQGDPKQLEELLGMNMGMVVSSVLQLCGSLTIAFVFGWKLALVATCVTVPIGLACAWYRFKYEMEFEKLSAAVSCSHRCLSLAFQIHSVMGKALTFTRSFLNQANGLPKPLAPFDVSLP